MKLPELPFVFGAILLAFAPFGTVPLNAATVPVPADAVAWWRAENDGLDAIGGSTATAGGSAAYAAGEVGQGFLIPVGSDRFSIPASTSIDLGASSRGFTVEFWVNPTATDNQPYLEWNNGSSPGLHLWNYGGNGRLYANLKTATADLIFQSAEGVISANSWQHVAMTYDRTTGIATLYRNGAEVATANVGNIAAVTGPGYALNLAGRTGWASGACKLDELTLYTRALSRTEVNGIYAAGTDGKVLPPPTLPSNAAAWLKGESNPQDSVGNNHGTWTGSATYAAGKVGQAFSVSSSDYVQVPASSGTDLGASANGFTVEFWVNSAATDNQPYLEWNNGASPGLHLWNYGGNGRLYADLKTDAADHIFQSADGVISATAWQHVAMTYDRTSGAATLYRNGAQVATANVGNIAVQTGPGYHLYLGHRSAPSPFAFTGLMDEVTLYTRALSGTEINTIWLAGSSGKANPSMNQAPVVSFSTNNVVRIEDSGPASLSGFATLNPGAGESGQSVTSVVTSNSSSNLFSGQPSIAANGTLTFTPAANANGIATVTVVAQDNGGTTNGGVDKSTNTFTITLSAVNDAPRFALQAGHEGTGTLDTSFADPKLDDIVQAMALDVNGRILAAGSFRTAGSGYADYYRLARFNADGTLDTSFANPNLNNLAAALAVDANGKILVGGWFSTAGSGYAPYRGLARFNADGTLDTSFADPNLNNLVAALAVDANGKILVGGSFNSAGSGNARYVGLARFHADGSLDTSFANPGFNGAINALAVDGNGKILVAGYFTTALNGNAAYGRLARFNADGTLDTSFANPNLNGSALALVVDANGKILVAGNFTTAGSGDAAYDRLARFNADGTLDTSFANPNLNGSGLAMAVDANGKILVAGNFTTAGSGDAAYNRLARFNADGTLDTSFANPNLDNLAAALAVNANGKILVGGRFTTAGSGNGYFRGRLARFHSAPPPRNLSVAANAGPQTEVGYATGISAGPADEAGQSVGLLVTNDNNALFSAQPAIASDGTLTFTPVATAHGSATVTVTAQDNGGMANGGVDKSAAQTFTIVVIAVNPNTAPSFALTGSAVPTVMTLAGSANPGSVDGAGTAASFNNPRGVALDSAGNLYVADQTNHKIRRITPAGEVTTLAGSGTEGSADGTGSAASFKNPCGVAVDSAGNVYVADTFNSKIRKITSAGVVTTLAGSGIEGGADGTGTQASFHYPYGVAVDAAGNVYVGDEANHKVRRITPAGVVTTLAGSGSSGSADGTGAAASFYYPRGVAVDNAGNVYVADQFNHKIRKITAAGVVTTLAGSGTEGSDDGIGTAASFRKPRGVAVDGAGNLYVGDTLNHNVRKITPSGVVTTLAGSSSPGSADGTGTLASFDYPEGVTVDSAGNVYVADIMNHKVRRITPRVVVSATGSAPFTQAGFAANISPGPSGEAGQTVAFHVANMDNALFSSQPAISADGTLTFTPAANGTTTVTVTAQDNGGTANGGTDTSAPHTFTIVVTGVNSAPTVVHAIPDQPARAGRLFNFTFAADAFADVDAGQTLTYTTSTLPTWLSFNPTTRTFSGTPADGDVGFLDITVTATDNGTPATSVADTFRITVTPGALPNAAPSFVLQGAGVGAGGLDTTFANPNVNGDVRALALDANGKILVGGDFTAAGSENAPYHGLARFNSDGMLDTSFANPNLDYPVWALAVDANGKILVGGWFTTAGSGNAPYRGLARFNADGTLDTSFANPNLNGDVRALALDANGRILVGGFFTTAGSGNAAYNFLARFNAEGSLDTSFVNPNLNAIPYELALDASGRILVGGDFTTAGSGNAPYHRLARFNADGTLDASFADPNLNGRAEALAVDGNGKILAGGTFTTAGSGNAPHDRFARFNADGTLDTSFANPSLNGAAYALALDANGKILVGGSFRTAGIGNADHIGLARFNSDGTVDNSFANPNLNNIAAALAVDANGKILVGGWFTTAGAGNSAYSRIARFISAARPRDLSVAANAGPQTEVGFATSISAGRAEEAGQTVAFIVTNNNNALFSGQPAIAADGTLTFTPAANANGSATVTVIARDNGGTANGGVDTSGAQTFTIVVTGVSMNTAPSFTLAASAEIAVTTLAGSGSRGSTDGTGTAASFSGPRGVAMDGASNQYVADYYSHKIRKISAAGVVTTLAGSESYGSADGAGTAASFYYPVGVAVDSAGNVYVADQSNHKIRKITAAGVVTTLAGTGSVGSEEGTGTAASFNSPAGVAVDSAGNVYVADTYNHRIRKITAAGVVTTLAGSGSLGSGLGSADGTGMLASFAYPEGVAVDGAGNVYVGDTYNHKIRKITAAGVVTTLAGSGSAGSGDGANTTASFNNPSGVAVDSAGNVYVADKDNSKIRKVSPAGAVTTLAGSGDLGSADGASATASFKNPWGVAVDSAGNVYVADTANDKIRRITHPVSVNGTGSGAFTQAGFASNISPGRAGEAGQTVAFIVTNNNNALFSGQPAIAADGTLTFTPAANANGSATVTVIAQDNGGTANGGVDTSAPQTFTITINAVNRAPSFNLAQGTPVGAIWTQQNSPALPWTVAAASEDGMKLVAAAWGTSIYTSTDRGVTWTARGPAQGWTGLASSSDGTKLVAAASGGQIYTSTDSGVTWTARSSAGTREWGRVACSADGTRIIAGVWNGEIYTSSDSGATWTARSGAGARFWGLVASSADGTKLAAASQNGKIYTSSDSGVTWTGRESDRNWYAMAMSADGTRLVAAAYGGPIYASTDSGATWIARSSGNRDWRWLATSYDGATVVAVDYGARGGIYVSTDSGVTWPVTANSPTEIFEAVTISGDGSTIVAPVHGASNGRIYTSVARPLGLSVAENAGPQTLVAFATGISAGPAHEVGQTVGFFVTNNNTALFSVQPSIAGNGTLTFTPAANATGSATVTVMAHDNGGTANGGADTSAAQSFNITVRSIVSATVVLGDLAQTFDGSPKSVSATTTPPGLALSLTYDGSPTAPRAEGTYTVVAAVTDPFYSGGATGVLVINPTSVSAQQAGVVGPGQDATFSTAPTQSGQGGVTVAAHNGGTSRLQVMAATHSTSPVAGGFSTGANYTDVRVWNDGPGDSLVVRFYYSSGITGNAEEDLVLQYHDGKTFVTVPGAVKDVADNLDGTVSGGRFTVTLDGTSTPRITELTGTVFAMAPEFRVFGGMVTGNGSLVISFPTETGNHYRLLGSSSPAGPWVDVGQPRITGDGRTQSFTVPTSGMNNFYRLISER